MLETSARSRHAARVPIRDFAPAEGIGDGHPVPKAGAWHWPPWPELHPLRRLLAGIPSSSVLDCGVRAQAGVGLAGGRGVPAPVLFLRRRCCFAHAGSNSCGICSPAGAGFALATRL